MIGKVIGALAGAQLSKQTAAIGGTGGAVLGAVAVPVIARMSIPALIAVGAGGYLAKRAIDRRNKAEATSGTGHDTTTQPRKRRPSGKSKAAAANEG